ncbi:MAG TPA: oxygen-dependent coproporphyrinogen oxidase [Cytophagales bacterium]|nr:oxygen-dependent coproporphyrinogen oxidase [Cytophagales bacterium]HAP59143.1 oxygen-dependent coproporphyrinogen oxidase [Cytophagales bacterium]
MDKHEISSWFQGLQDRICSALEQTDGRASFREDAWDRPGGGGGRARVIQNGNILEKGGVNWSAVHGQTPEAIKKQLGNDGDEFFATGVSIVMHPQSPMVPIIHMNVRYFEMSNGVHWFGGGIDLTPHYVDVAQAKWFHQQLKAVCDAHHADYYDEFKPWADRYFYLKHRKETRGVGGIFFDRLRPTETVTKEDRWAFVQAVGEAFAPIYTHLMQQNEALSYGERERDWQRMRRGRYVEFNLVWDAGTKFGLETDGRTESILMSLPPQANWAYNFQPEPGSKEEATLHRLKQDIDWILA